MKTKEKKQKYKEQVNFVKKLIADKRNQYLTNILKTENSATFWRLVKKLMHKSTNKATVPPDEYNNYYVSLAENLLKCTAKSTEDLFLLTKLLYCNISHSKNTVWHAL